ncbi:hypothetical protein ONE63_000705 [Megalurothrips usitatus]|uniref:FACT complex subunit SSRP1 n=1 Tax=Megalurothrips usitatus TaxID=439358 RepID=A0AAV7XZA6_9NEOP|nr:hypothetical protein ONE63_000705 [Megalurothrips usitatus]
MDFLEYNDIKSEIKGANVPGKLKFTDQHIIFKNNKTGKVDQVVASDVEIANWQKFGHSWALRIFLKNGTLHRFTGFKESDTDKVGKFFKSSYSHDIVEKDLCIKGWNWGTARFQGAVLSFDVGSAPAFEIPLNNVSQCTPGKNEVTIEYHQNDDAPVNLVEMRFHIPSSEMSGADDPVEAFHQQVMKKASVINVSGDAIAIFREIQCITPRGRYDIKVFQTFFQLHGKTFDYKIPVSTVLRLFILPHKDGRQMFFVVSLDPPIKQGQTRYHFLTFLFSTDEPSLSIELPFSEEELKEKFEGKLPKEVSGPTYEVMGKVMKAIVNRKITVPGSFVGHSGTPAVGCSYKAAAGYMYPLERGFIYVHKPPIHIRYEEINSVNFARSGANTRSFDFEVELKSGVVHTFSSIEKEEYAKLWDFISGKNLRVKNSGKTKDKNYEDAFSDSENEDEPDAYLARVKAEAKERDEDGGEDESTDEDFVPGEMPDDDNSVGSGSSMDSDEGSDASAESPNKEKKPAKEKKEKKKEKEEKPKKEKAVSEKPRKRQPKKEKDDNKPKRPQTAFMLWLNDSREKIKEDNPGISVTEIAKKGGELWKELKSKSEWEAKAAKLKEEYAEAMKEYTASGGGASSSSAAKKETSSKKASKSKVTTVSPSKVVSKEYISDDDSSSDDEKPVKKEVKKKEEKKTAKKSKASSEEEEETDESSGSDAEPPAKKKANGKKKPKDEEEDEEEAETTPDTSDEDSD